MEEVASGGRILKVTGILFIVFAVIGIMGVVSTAILFQRITNLNLDATVPGGISGIIVSSVLSIIECILNIIIGISGIKWSKDVIMAKKLIVFAIILIIFYIVYLVITYSIMKVFPWISLIRFILPGIFLIGAYMNFKSTSFYC